jgi:hypothetical protein
MEGEDGGGSSFLANLSGRRTVGLKRLSHSDKIVTLEDIDRVYTLQNEKRRM